MRDRRTVAIDSISESPTRHGDFDAIVLVDVICDTTTLVTAVAQGRAAFPAASAPAALHIARGLGDALVGADEEEAWRPGFDVPNSPAAIAALNDRRPLVLSCLAGATLAANGLFWPEVYLACLRNLAATAHHLALRHRRVLILDAASDGDIRCEDQLAAARIARQLVGAGFEPSDFNTKETLERWGEADLSLLSWGRSAENLRRRRRTADLEFVLAHIDDLDTVCALSSLSRGAAVVAEPPRALSVTA
ncbi:MAG: 2-phosphosulfolactate phosphatase [Zetaproteobacteria bacterium]|nr:MAG: 2-phosphosulfolactate phosphatase [Zetaproteobacteria bacterium]